MKVALISEWLDAWRGGAETSTVQFMHQVMDAGVELHVFTRSRPAPAPGLFVYTISGASMSRTRRSVTFARRVERALEETDFDVIHAISPCRGADIYQPRGGTIAETLERNVALRRSAAGRGIKRYASRLNLKQRYLLRMERALMGDPGGPTIVAISDYVVDQLRRHYALPDGRIHKIYNAIEVDQTPSGDRAIHRREIRREFSIRDDDLLILELAHNFRLKGVGRWMEALATLGERGVRRIRSLIVGRGDSIRWHRRAANLGLNGQLTFVGPSDRVREFLHASDVLVHPTYYDPCSRVVLEAMSAGLACITTRWDGAAEMIEPGKSGFVLHEPTDVGQLADHVVSLMNESCRQEMGREAAAIAPLVGMDRHAREMLTLYEKVRTEKRKAR
jgi:UDP-glucose:(heptosyl)LPS alpha-1,3-glucosyltransferase